MTITQYPDVDLVVNCYERTYETVLSPGFLNGIGAQCRFPFRRKIVLLNNVRNPSKADRLAEAMLTSGELTRLVRVARELPRTLAIVGLSAGDLAPIPHYSDCALVAVTLPGSRYLCYWDADVAMVADNDWISPSVDLLESRSDVLSASPEWTYESRMFQSDNKYWRPLDTVGDFGLYYGFSDQLFLAKRTNLACPIYREFCIASLRYPLAHVKPVFEQRVDSYMRNHGYMRAVHRPSRYVHNGKPGLSYPFPTLARTAREIINKGVILKAARRLLPRKKFNCT
jgi:hypothetical protein